MLRSACIGLLLVSAIHGAGLQAGDAEADADADEHVYGLGRATCDRYVKARETSGFAEVTYKSWISGYLSARHGAGDQAAVSCNTAFASALRVLDDYCERHRQQSLFRAMQQVSAGADCAGDADMPGNQ